MRLIDRLHDLPDAPVQHQRLSFVELFDKAIDAFSNWWDELWHFDKSDHRTYPRP